MSGIQNYLSRKFGTITPESWDALMRYFDQRFLVLEEQLGIERRVTEAIIARGLQVIEDGIGPAIIDANEAADYIKALGSLGGIFSATSSSSVTIGGGTKNFVVSTDKRAAFAPPAYLMAYVSGDMANAIIGRVLSYNAVTGALVVSVETTKGAGTHSSWVISPIATTSDLEQLRDQIEAAKSAAASSAGNSASSASAAQSSAEAAATQNTQAQSAKSGAETAQAGAVAAKSASETARDASVAAKVSAETLLEKSIRVDGTQAFTPAEQGQALANIGAGVLSGFRDKIINGNFDVWQHGVSQTSHGYGSDDLWQNNHIGSTKTHSRQSFELGQTAVPGNPKYYSRTAVVSVAGASNWVSKVQKIEGVETLAGQKATLTFYARANHAGDKLSVEFVQIFGTGGSPSASVTGLGVKKVTLGTEFQRYDAIVDLPSISGKTLGSNGNDRLEVIFWFDAGSDFDARTGGIGRQSGTFDIACVSLVKGDASKDSYPFSARHIAQETALCERYSLVIDHTDGASAPIAFGYNHNATSARLTIPVATRLRLVPTFSLLAGNFVLISAGSVLSGLDASKVTVIRATSKGVDIIVDITGAGFAGGQPVIMQQSGVKILLDARL